MDYDIPQKPAKKRVQFYRDLNRLIQHCHYEYSTLSVVRTEDEYLAEAVYFLVMAYKGNAHIYRAEEIVPRFG